MKLGCCVDIVNVKTACDLGYDFVDLSGIELVNLSMEETDRLSEYLLKRNIPCIGIHAALPGSISLIGEEYQETALRQYMESLVERGRRLNVRYIGIGSPNSRKLKKGMVREAADGQMVRSLGVICETARDFLVLLENLNLEETNYINSLQEAYAIEKCVKKENIGLVCDIYHFMKSKETVEELPKELLSEIKYLHIADPDGRKYPSSSSGLELFSTMKRIIELTEVKCLAIEAISTDFNVDALYGREILQKQLEELEG